MGMSIDGFDDLFGTMEALGQVGKKVGKKAVKEGLKVTVSSLKRYAPKDSGEGAENLKVISIKAYKSGSVWGKCGIDSSNWDESGHLWYQNYGYENYGLNFSGDKVNKHIGWIEEAFKKCKNEAESEMFKEIENELDKILR